MLLAGGAIAGAIATLAFAPRSGASTAASPSLNGNVAPGNIYVYVANYFGRTVTVYPTGSNGNVAPSATIGDDDPTSGLQLDEPQGVALDASGNTYVVTAADNTVSVFPPARGGRDIFTSAIIAGPNTGLNFPVSIALDANGNIYVANDVTAASAGTVTVYPAGSNGNAAPMWTISGSNTGLDVPNGIALDARGNIYVANNGSYPTFIGTVTVYPAGSDGNVAPSSTIVGSNTGLNGPYGIALDASDNIYVANSGSYPFSTVTVYPAGSDGNVAPSSTIVGSNTGLNGPYGIALDAGGNIYVADEHSDTVTVYPPGSDGNVAPIATIVGPATQLDYPAGIAVGALPTPTPTQTATPTPSPTPTATPTATPAGGTLSLSTHALKFQTLKAGKGKHETLSFTIENIGKGKLSGLVDTSGIAPPLSVTAGAGAFSLARNKSRKVSVGFAPTSAGTFPGAVNIATSDPKHPTAEVSITARGR